MLRFAMTMIKLSGEGTSQNTSPQASITTSKGVSYSTFLNPLNLTIKIRILICCPYSFPTEIVGRSCLNIKQIHLM